MKIIQGIVLLYCLTFLQDLAGQIPFPSVDGFGIYYSLT